MKVSVIVPVLNEADSIERCLSALGTGFAQEILVVDGGSEDTTVEKALDKCARVWHSPPGLSQQCNFGAEKARGEILLFLSARCQISPDWFEALQSSLNSPYVIGGGFRLQVPRTPFSYRLATGFENLRSRYLRMASIYQGLFVRRDAYFAVSGMDVESPYSVYNLCSALKKQGEFVLRPEESEMIPSFAPSQTLR